MMNHPLFRVRSLLAFFPWAAFCNAQTPGMERTVTSTNQNKISNPLGDPACPGQGSCCIAHGGPGCDNTTCCNSVCAADFLCCFFWDSDCVAMADSMCSVCAGTCPGSGDCCTAHAGGGCGDAICCELVCLSMPSCCETGWTAACATKAQQICDACDVPPLFDCPQAGDCCTGRDSSAGCERAACCQTVCEMDSVCCTEVWDNICAREAAENCVHVCECAEYGNFDADSTINLRDAAAFMNCYSGSGSPPAHVECACADYNGDGDSDLDDFGFFADLLD
jgi:hypothetical protein